MSVRRPERYQGWLAINKEPGLTSAKVVDLVKRITGIRKAGHGGTLDPFSEGLLPVACGEATKTLSWVLTGDKAYQCWVRFGQETDTGDPTGQVVEETGHLPTRAEIEDLLPRFTGVIDQVPPVYSAVRVGGERAYKRVRRGETVELESRQVTIYALTLLDYADGVALLEVKSSKGAYMRALARDMGRVLGCRAHLSRLVRTHTLGFTLAQAVTLEGLREAVIHNRLSQLLFPIDQVLDDIPALTMGAAAWHRLNRGQEVWAEVVGKKGDAVRLLDPEGRFGAVGELVALSDTPDRWQIKPKRLFLPPPDRPPSHPSLTQE